MIELHPDEQIIVERRKFWLPIATEAAAMFLVAITPAALINLLPGILPETAELIVARFRMSLNFFAAVWALFAWITISAHWTNYYLDILLVTNKRVLDIEQKGLFARDLAETRIENIQDVRVEVIGILASLLHFGNLHIQTAAVNREFVIRNIRDPNGVKDAIARAHETVKTGSASGTNPPSPQS